jgi:DNA modification methylase
VIRILHGDCRDILPTLEAGSVQCCVTSPPYFGLRSYLDAGHIDKLLELGTEATPDAYVAALVDVFRKVRPVLADTGTVWLNLGDGYNNFRVSKGPGQAVHGRDKLNGKPAPDSGGRGWKGLKEKDLLLIPARVALALQADGWFLRSAIVWAKPNPMPESVTDRPTSSYEMVYLLTKRATYFYDAEAVRETLEHPNRTGSNPIYDDLAHGQARDRGRSDRAIESNPNGRNCRNVWTIATSPFPEAHFATMAPELAERCIRAGSKPGDTILDPFSGAGTTALVADRLQRHGIGIELNPAYADMARDRVRNDAGMFGEVA